MTLPTPGKIENPSKNTMPPVFRESHHPLEDWMNRAWVRRITGWLTADRPGKARPHLLRAMQTYADPAAPLHERVAYAPIHLILDRLRGKLSREQLREKLSKNNPTLRGVIATARSLSLIHI